MSGDDYLREQCQVLTKLVRSSWRIKMFEEEDLPGTTLRIYKDADSDGYTDVDGDFIQEIIDGFHAEKYEITFSQPEEECWITFEDIDIHGDIDVR